MKKILLVALVVLSTLLKAQDFVRIRTNDLPVNTKINCYTMDLPFVWLGTNKGIYAIEFIEDGSVKEVTHRKTSKPVLALLNTGRKLWTSIEKKGIYIFDKKTYQFKGFAKKCIGNSSVKGIVEDKASLYLIESNGTAFLVDLLDSSCFKSSNIKENNAIVEKSDSVLHTQQKLNRELINDNLSTKFSFLSKEVYDLGTKRIVVAKQGLLYYTASRVKPKEATNVNSSALNTSSKEKLSKEATDTLTSLNEGESMAEDAVSCSNPKHTSYLLLTGVFLLNTLLVFWLTKRKYQKDIVVLENEILKKK